METQKHDAIPVPTKFGQLQDKFLDVFEPPTTPHPCAIQYHIELLDPTRPIPNHKQYRLSQTELDKAK